MMTSNKIEGYFIQQNWRLFSFWAPRFSKISTLSRDGHIQAFAIRRLVGDDRLTVQKQVVPGGHRLSPHWHAVRCSGVFLSLGRIPSFLQGETSGPATRLTYYIINGIATTKLWWLQSWFLLYYFHLGNYYEHTIYITYFANCNLQLDHFHDHHLCPAWHHGMGCIGNGPRFAKYADMCVCADPTWLQW